MVSVTPFKAEHAMEMKVRDLTPEFSRIVENESYLRMLEMLGPGYTLRVDGEVIGCLIMVLLVYPGTAEAVILMSDAVEHHKKLMHRMCKNYFGQTMETHKLHRVEARIEETNERSRDWAVAMGMIPEGPNRALGPNGEDYIMYARIRREPCQS